MSYRAINDVTQALRIFLRSQLNAQLNTANAVVTLLPPGDTLPDGLGVNLYLYRVAESPFTRNQPWPGDRVTDPSKQPALGLQLSYLLTPLGTNLTETTYVPEGDAAHTALGASMLTFHQYPVLNDVHLPGFDADTNLPDYLLNSYEKIKIYLAPVSIEELSKIWSTINKPYRLSIAYEVSLIELTPTPAPPVNGGIVTSTGVAVITLSPPRLTALAPSSTGALVSVPGGTVTPNDLQINGFGFSLPGASPTVRVAGQVVAIKGVPAPTDTSLTVTLPINVEGGPQVDVTMALIGPTSASLTFNVTPWLASISPIRTALGIPPSKLTLNGLGFTLDPLEVQFDGPTPNPITSFVDPLNSDTLATTTIPATLPNGLYTVRIVLGDLAHSGSNARTLEVIPRLDVPIVVASVPVGGKMVHRLTLNGARLDDPSDVRLIIDDETYVGGANPNPVQLVYFLGRMLDPGPHQIAVLVGGSQSHTVGFEV